MNSPCGEGWREDFSLFISHLKRVNVVSKSSLWCSNSDGVAMGKISATYTTSRNPVDADVELPAAMFGRKNTVFCWLRMDQQSIHTNDLSS